jgi:hypothetical protein
MALFGMGGYQLHQFRLRLSPHLESATACRLDIQTSQLLILFGRHDFLLLYG